MGFLDETAINSFREFATQTSPEELSPLIHRSLADYICSWVMAGYGVRVCQGDFQRYTLAIIAIIEEWHRTPDLLDYVYYVSDDPKTEEMATIERRVTTISDGGLSGHDILDPYFFAKATFRELHGNRPLSPSDARLPADDH
ncbi:hypothetical protein CF165_23695 [Amycolatopsis vastitatis]|uniref:Uncharacterized protein n=2 Tax=Amycolatopsis vastitatis TaxID=1905142 RepID=A0A229T2L7_9PSEU|nr:hypothetical protein CF165_23695 [Amycolatopsis vastitatis]